MKLIHLLILIAFIIILIAFLIYNPKKKQDQKHLVESRKVSNAVWMMNENKTIISFTVTLYHIDDDIESIFIRGDKVEHQVVGEKKKSKYSDDVIIHGMWLTKNQKIPNMDELDVHVNFKHGGVLTFPFEKKE
tara:strand:- start:10812 stop:11210 length:399 start_codon:yes stop_codon:yes gene_type:complete